VLAGRLLRVRHKATVGARRSRALIGVLVAALAIAAVAVGIAVSQSPSSHHGHSPASGAASSGAHAPSSPSQRSAQNFVAAASGQELRRLSASLRRPIYWAGPQAGAVYELTVAANGRVYIRYLIGGAKVGSPRSDFLTIGTYPVANPATDLRRAARSPGSVVLTLPHGAFGVYNTARPTSVYLTYPGSHEEVETYDPSPTVARALVESGGVKPIG
jgi:hypothetical protein